MSVSTWVEVQRVGVLSFDSLPPEFFESQFSSLDSETEANLRPRDSVFRVRFLLLPLIKAMIYGLILKLKLVKDIIPSPRLIPSFVYPRKSIPNPRRFFG